LLHACEGVLLSMRNDAGRRLFLHAGKHFQLFGAGLIEIHHAGHLRRSFAFRRPRWRAQEHEGPQNSHRHRPLHDCAPAAATSYGASSARGAAEMTSFFSPASRTWSFPSSGNTSNRTFIEPSLLTNALPARTQMLPPLPARMENTASLLPAISTNPSFTFRARIGAGTGHRRMRRSRAADMPRAKHFIFGLRRPNSAAIAIPPPDLRLRAETHGPTRARRPPSRIGSSSAHLHCPAAIRGASRAEGT